MFLFAAAPSAEIVHRLQLLAADPGVSPNGTGLPGLSVVKQTVGALLTWGLLASVAGFVVSVIFWTLAHQQGNYSHAAARPGCWSRRAARC